MMLILRGLRGMTRISAAIGSLALIVLFLAAPGEAEAQDARAFIARLGNQAIEVLGPSVSAAQRQARFRELFQNDFDMPGISQFVLGRYWRIATPQEQQDFIGLFQEYIVRAYSLRLSEYGGEPFRVTGTRQNGAETVVTSEIIRPNGGRIAVDWYLIDRGGAHKITDVYVGGVSMKVTQRDEFASVIQRNGGQVGALIAQLRQKLAGAG
jgi:phospholipid transport system substrate-binding protein